MKPGLNSEKPIAARIFYNALAFLGGEFFYRLINFFSCILIARALGGEGYGQFSFIYVYLSFFEVFVQFGLNSVLTRELSQRKEGSAQILGNALLLRTGLVVCTIPLALWLIGRLGYPLSVQQGVWLASFQLFLTLRPVYESIFRAELAMFYPALWNAFRALLNLSLVVFAAAYLPKMVVFISAYLVSGIVGLAGIAVSSHRRMACDFRPDGKLMLRLLKEAVPLVTSGYLTLIYYRVDVVMLSMMKTFKDIGYYSVATRITESLTMISGALLVSYFPLLANAFKQNRGQFESFFQEAARWLLLLGLPLAVGGGLVAQDLVLLFFGSEYAPSGLTLVILLWYTFFCFIGSLLANVLIACGKQVGDMWISGFLVLLNIGLNALLIPVWSYNGAAIATVATEATGVVIYFLYAARNPLIRLKLPKEELLAAVRVNLLFAAFLFFSKWLLRLHVIPFVSLGIVGYGALLFFFRLISWSDLKKLLGREAKQDTAEIKGEAAEFEGL